ncbi:MAG: exodeoxyribonuclease VII small subunit [Propionibacteriaceae bacterium]|nr:exodeoxyribonuclease VII small subunit [Propionibacteriaceae bacterium]
MSDATQGEAVQVTGADELSYEAARDELIEVVRKLEAGGASLAESMRLWERGEKLADICQRWLDGARAKVDQARKASQEAQP